MNYLKVYSQIKNSCIYILKFNRIRENIGFIKSEKPYEMASVLTINGLLFVAINVLPFIKNQEDFYTRDQEAALKQRCAELHCSIDNIVKIRL